MSLNPKTTAILHLIAHSGIDGKNQVAIAVALLHTSHEYALEKDKEYKEMYQTLGADQSFPTQIEQASCFLAYISNKVNQRRSSESSHIEA